MKKLAVFTPSIGIRSETFIQRHIEQLSPENTVVLTSKILTSDEKAWGVTCPAYCLRRPKSVFCRGGKVALRRLGFDSAEYLDIDGIKRFLLEHEVDVVLGQYLNKSWPLIKITNELGLQFFAHAHGSDLSISFCDPMWRRRYADYKHANGVIVVNQVMKERLLSVGVPGKKIHIIPYGVEVPRVFLTKNEGGIVQCLAVGRMVGKKAPLKLLEAFRVACQEFPGLRLDYVGTGPLYKAVQKYLDKYELNRSVSLYGGQPHDVVMKLMGKADIFLQHSVVDPKNGDEEGVPVAILEAMAMGLPVVATRHAGIPDAVIEDLTGVLVDEGDVDGMARHIVGLAGDTHKRSRFGEQSWQVAQSKFTWGREKEALTRVMGLL